MPVIRKWAFLNTTIRQVNSPRYHPLLAGTRSQRAGLAALDPTYMTWVSGPHTYYPTHQHPHARTSSKLSPLAWVATSDL